MENLLRTFSRLQFDNVLKSSIHIFHVPNRGVTKFGIPKKRLAPWLQRPTRVNYNQELTKGSKSFIAKTIKSQLGVINTPIENKFSPLKISVTEPTTAKWREGLQRTGLIGKKIGVYPMWLKNGTKVSTTLLQIVDNEVVKYTPPEKHKPMRQHKRVVKKRGCLLVGAENTDPQHCTRQYYGIFKAAGIMPKRMLCRFYVSPEAALSPGTPLYASHYKPGDIVDIRAQTMYRGFHGVMKRWGFKGMPATHGVTKTHRKAGNTGSGGKKARLMPGTKMAGHVGNVWRVQKGYRILRINTKYNVIWIMGQNVPGDTNSFCYLYDTILPLRKARNPHFPTYLPNAKRSMPEELYADDVQRFDEDTIIFNQEKS